MTTDVTLDPIRTHDHYVRAGAIEPIVDETLTDEWDEVVDLTGKSVRFRMRQPNDTSLVVDDTATIVSESDGTVEYTWSDSDTEDPGHYLAEFAVDSQGNTGTDFDDDFVYPVNRYLSIKITDTL